MSNLAFKRDSESDRGGRPPNFVSQDFPPQTSVQNNKNRNGVRLGCLVMPVLISLMAVSATRVREIIQAIGREPVPIGQGQTEENALDPDRYPELLRYPNGEIAKTRNRPIELPDGRCGDLLEFITMQMMLDQMNGDYVRANEVAIDRLEKAEKKLRSKTMFNVCFCLDDDAINHKVRDMMANFLKGNVDRAKELIASGYHQQAFDILNSLVNLSVGSFHVETQGVTDDMMADFKKTLKSTFNIRGSRQLENLMTRCRIM
ncbi:hypothetical protein KA119_02010 [Candidatus Gracilibacteria bacterium]|nr:hypothetical protein [Candidatus Gracilibacteria bacterium]